MSFELRGRDDDGVIHFTGLDRGPALLEWLVVMAVGLVFLSAIVMGAVAAAVRGHIASTLAAIPFTAGVAWLGIGGALWWLRVRRRLATLATLRDLSDRTGVGEDDLLNAAKRADVRPVYRLNRVDLYDPAGFDAGSLLRSSDGDAQLLLPAILIPANRYHGPPTDLEGGTPMHLRRLSHQILITAVIATAVPLTARAGVQAIGDVVYGHKFGMALTMDVVKPEKPNGIGVLWMLSGGWASGGEPLASAGTAKPFTDRGQTVFLVRHGSQPKFTLDEVVADIHRAVRFVRLHAKEYGVDPDRLGIAGASSGGHLSTTIGTMGRPGDPTAKDPLDRVSSRVQAVACFFPPLDLVDYGKPGQDFLEMPAVKPFYHVFALDGKPRDEQIAKLRAFSPFYAASKDTPPTLIIQGDMDILVPNEQADRFIDKLKSLGVPCEEVKRPGKGHGWPGIEKDMDLLAAWFDKYLASKPAQ